MVNPYLDKDFCEFFVAFFVRLWGFLLGKHDFGDLVSDEIQILVFVFLSISGALVGTFLVLRKMSMLANALSHTILLGIVGIYLLVSLLFPRHNPGALPSVLTLFVASIITGLLTTFVTTFLADVMKLQIDASIGLVFSLFFSLGIVLVSILWKNVDMGTELIMGNADTLRKEDIRDVFVIMLINFSVTILFFHGLKISTFDPQLARTLGFVPWIFSYLLMVQTSATAISGFRAGGVFMILAFFVIPPLFARLFTDSLMKMLLIGCCIGVGVSLLGVALSRCLLTFWGLGLPTGGIVVTMLGFAYLLCMLILHFYKTAFLRSAVK